MGDIMKKENKQNIKCDVHTCKYCNCDCDVCELREIEIKNQCGCGPATDKNQTICSSYKIRDDIK